MTEASGKPRVGLAGFFGFGNFGDELFIQTHQQQLGDFCKPDVISDLPRSPYFSKPVRQMVQPFDAVIIGGGDLLTAAGFSRIYWRPEFLKKPVFVFGVSVHQRDAFSPQLLEKYRAFLQHPNCKLVMTRDPESMDWVQQHIKPAAPVHWAPDPVCALDLPPACPQDRALGLVLRSRLPHGDDLSQVRAMLDRAREMGYSIKHLVLANKQRGQDELEVVRAFAQADEPVLHTESLPALCQAISSCTLLATMKFHGLVLASLYGVPSIAMWDTLKVRSFLDLIERPEMFCRYDNPLLHQRLSHYPASVPARTRNWLRTRSQAGYALLRHHLQQTI